MKFPDLNFEFAKQFDKFYLFTFDEIIRNKDFEIKLKRFSKNINGEEIIFETIIPPPLFEFLKNNQFTRISNIEGASFDDFFKKTFYIEDSEFACFDLNFYIYDHTFTWQIYCSFTSEFAILGIEKERSGNVIDFLQPYQDNSFESKLTDVSSMFVKKYRKEFMQSLTQKICFEK